MMIEIQLVQKRATRAEQAHGSIAADLVSTAATQKQPDAACVSVRARVRSLKGRHTFRAEIIVVASLLVGH